MNEAIAYQQEKNGSSYKLNLSITREGIIYSGDFNFENDGKDSSSRVRYYHELVINMITGDFQITYMIENPDEKSKKRKPTSFYKKNDFSKLQNLVLRGFLNGEKDQKFWGVKYNNEILKIFEVIKEVLVQDINNDIITKKINDNDPELHPLYKLIINYHLAKKEVKYHDLVYYHILTHYPQKKWLKSNENKFLPAILDELGIKSKYLIGELSSVENGNINLNYLSFLCHLFGDTYTDYIKKFNWKKITLLKNESSRQDQLKKTFACKTDIEKTTILKILSESNTPEILIKLSQLFQLRSFVEEYNYDFKLKIKSEQDIDYLMDEWSLIKKQISMGYKLKYNIPKEIIDELESPIKIGNEVFIPKLLLSEEEFVFEGSRMKNCIGRNFNMGAICLFFSLYLKSNNKRINLQFQRGSLVQSYGKANSPVKDIFEKAIKILTSRVNKYNGLTWSLEKYDI